MLNHFLQGHAPMTEREAQMISPLRLAYIGDAVYDLYVRTELVFQGGKAHAMHRDAIKSVNAAAQAHALSWVQPLLTETEADVVRRGRNAHPRHAVPKRADPADYSYATGLEALLGFLYLTGRTERLLELYTVICENQEVATCPKAP